MIVFITGCTGLIGHAVTLGLRRAGHTVYAMVRSKDKAKELIAHEIQVFVGDCADPRSYRDIALRADVMIHLAVDYGNFEKVDTTIVDTLLAVAKEKDVRPKLIYTSGVMVYPDSKHVQHEDSGTVGTKTKDFLGYRVHNEYKVLKSKDVYGTSVRPGFVISPEQVHFGAFFEQAQGRDKTVTVESPDIMWSTIHLDDLVDAYIRIAEAPPAIVQEQVFTITDDARFTRLQIAKAFASAVGDDVKVVSGKELDGPSAKSCVADHKKATRLLGWYPRHLPVLDEVNVYYQAWLALHQ